MTTETLPSLYPSLISVPRITTLVGSAFVSMASGTNYTFSVWAPQLGARLGLSNTRLNMMAVAVGVGVCASGPFWGKIVDTRGPRILLVGAAICLLSGYSGIRTFFDAGLLPNETTLSTFQFLVLSACNLAIGVATSAGHLSSTNVTAKSFPDRARATTTGLVIAALGLSAFFFSTMAHLLFPGDTSSFLLFLAVGTTLPMILGFFLVRPIPLPPSKSRIVHHNIVEGDPGGIEAAAVHFQPDDDSRTHLLLEDSEESSEIDQPVFEAGNTSGLSRSRSLETYSYSSRGSAVDHDHLGSAKDYHEGLPNIHGMTLCRTPDFWLLFSMITMLTGTGVMYINNVGSMSQALYAYKHPVYDDKEAQKWQTVQVSIFSITNFSGRIIIGLVSDLIKTRLRWPRSYCLVLVSLIMFTSQCVATRIEDLESLWVASSILGLGYGSIQSLMPSMCVEWFGLPHFSENWGYLSTSPLLGANFFAMVFGRNLDAHQPPAHHGSTDESSGRMCLEGKACYVDALYMTMSACALSVGLSVYAARRDQKKLAKLESRGRRALEA